MAKWKKSNMIWTKGDSMNKFVRFTGGNLWSREVCVGPGQPLNDGIFVVACRKRLKWKSSSLQFGHKNGKLVSWYLPLHGGAWQVRFVIGLGSLQLCSEVWGLEHTTWRSWVPFPQETEHCECNHSMKQTRRERRFRVYGVFGGKKLISS